MLRGLVLTALLIDAGLIVMRMLTYPGVFSISGFSETVGLVALSLVAAAIFTVASIYAERRSRSLILATATGAVGGAILIAHMALENVGARVGEDWRLTVVVMLATFGLWFSSGWRSGYNSTLVTGAVAGCWTALVSVILAVTFGFIGMYFDLPSSAYVATWPEYARSGSTDPQAFAIANTLDAATSHLATALILGAILGAGGWFVASLRKTIPSPER